MIVDDKTLIMGSANINDRSMLGDRDSEIAVVVEGRLDFEAAGSENGRKVNRKIHDYRKMLFKEHFGQDVIDPTSDQTWFDLWSIANSNTCIYGNYFRCFPSNEYRSFDELKRENRKTETNSNYDLEKIQGHVVLYPYYFLDKVDLISNLRKEFFTMFMPIDVLF